MLQQNLHRWSLTNTPREDNHGEEEDPHPCSKVLRVRDWSGFGWFVVYSVLFSFFVITVPPPAREPGAIWIKLDRTHTWTQVRLAFWVSLWLISRNFCRPTPLAEDMSMAFVVDLFQSLTARPSLLSLSFGVHCRLRSLTVQRCRSGFRGATPSTRGPARGLGVSMNFPYFFVNG